MSQAERLRILVVAPSLPYPPIWGSGMRVYQLLRHLARRHDVSLLTYAAAGETAGVLALRQAAIDVHTVAPKLIDEGNRRLAQLASLPSPVSFQQRCVRSGTMQAALDRLLATERFDVIQVESSQMGGFAFGTGSPVLLDEHNIEYELLYRMFCTERSVARKSFNWLEYVKFRREERRAWRRADGCIVPSAREAAIVREYAAAKPTAVVPNSVDVDFFRPSETAPDPDSIVFTGLMRYRPNIDAVLHFTQQILPLIRRVRPNVTFTVVGAGAPDDIQRLAGQGIVVTGAVDDVRPYVARAAVFVVPLRMGSGTRLKILEGLAMGKAIVSTPIGCEGINLSGGDHLLIADDPPAFAHEVLRLLDDPDLSSQLGHRGRALAEAEYSWASAVQHLEAFYRQIIASVYAGRQRPDDAPNAVASALAAAKQGVD